MNSAPLTKPPVLGLDQPPRHLRKLRKVGRQEHQHAIAAGPLDEAPQLAGCCGRLRDSAAERTAHIAPRRRIVLAVAVAVHFAGLRFAGARFGLSGDWVRHDAASARTSRQ